MRRTATGSGDRNGERGATLVESMLAICFLFFLFFALLQVYHWCLQTVFCQYSAFYGSKGIALGYQPSLAMRGARIAAIAISGRELSHQTGREEERARAYMTQGDNSGVVYEYWFPRRTGGPELRLYGPVWGDEASGTVRLSNAPLLHPGLARPLGIAENPEPTATVTTFNYSQLYLEE